MNDLYEVLEICLQDIEQGADIETVLFRYPDFADELRPILEGSLNARGMAIVAPSPEVVRRNRAKVLQYSAQLRETNVKSPSRRLWFASLRRVAVTLAVVATLFISGTGLVSAASTTLPGDNLYPVKRTWEDVLLLFTFNVQQREALEIEHENNRFHEVQEIFAQGRSAEVEFSGIVTVQKGNEWTINGIPVIVSGQTEVREGPIVVGSAVRVEGHTQPDGIVLAERVRLLPPDAKLPDEVEVEQENHEGPNNQYEDNSGKGSEGEELQVEETKTPESESKDESSNSGSGSDNSGSGSDENGNDSAGSNEDNSGSSNNDNGGSNDNGGDDNSGSNSNDGGGDDSGGGNDNSGSGGDGGGGGED